MIAVVELIAADVAVGVLDVHAMLVELLGASPAVTDRVIRIGVRFGWPCPDARSLVGDLSAARNAIAQVLVAHRCRHVVPARAEVRVVCVGLKAGLDEPARTTHVSGFARVDAGGGDMRRDAGLIATAGTCAGARHHGPSNSRRRSTRARPAGSFSRMILTSISSLYQRSAFAYSASLTRLCAEPTR